MGSWFWQYRRVHISIIFFFTCFPSAKPKHWRTFVLITLEPAQVWRKLFTSKHSCGCDGWLHPWDYIIYNNMQYISIYIYIWWFRFNPTKANLMIRWGGGINIEESCRRSLGDQRWWDPPGLFEEWRLSIRNCLKADSLCKPQIGCFGSCKLL